MSNATRSESCRAAISHVGESPQRISVLITDNSVDTREIVEGTDSNLMSTSSVLNFCKSKILYPYLKLLALMGFRPVSLNQIQNSKFIRILSNFHTILITLLICFGYAIQYMSCFRRDRGYYLNLNCQNFQNGSKSRDEICYSNATFSYFIPDCLHFIGYVYTVYLFRISDSESLQNLMERVFLLSSFPPQRTAYTSPKKLLKILWIYIITSIIWMAFCVMIVGLMTSHNKVQFIWFPNVRSYVVVGKIFLVLCTFLQDMVQITAITSYCMQAHLLTAHLDFLRKRLLTRTISPLDWMREMAEFKKLLNHLNDIFAPAVCAFAVLNICWTLSGFAWIFNIDQIEILMNQNIILHVANGILLMLAGIAPFISAARLTSACTIAQTAALEIAVRPFLYQDANQEILNAVLLYASSLKLSGKIFRLPITGRVLCVSFAILLITLLVFGMCHSIRFY